MHNDYIADRHEPHATAGETVRPRPRWQDMDERDVAGDAAAEKAAERDRQQQDAERWDGMA